MSYRIALTFSFPAILLAALAAACGSEAGSVCGPGTTERDGVCVLGGDDAGPSPDAGDEITCGPGTHLEGDECLPDGDPDGASYELRLVDPSISADGHSRVPLLAIGTTADGSPATDQVMMNSTRPGVGSFDPPVFGLGTLGTLVYYTPCNATQPGCTGPITFTLALATAPGTVVASAEAELAEPEGVASADPCLIGGNVMFFDGNDYIYNGIMTVTEGAWSATGASSSIRVSVNPLDPDQGLWWDLEFTTTQLGTPLVPGVYENAERAPFADPGHPGIDVGGDGRGCNTISGRFEVHEYVLAGGEVTSVTVSFEQHCEDGASVLSGCVHYEQ